METYKSNELDKVTIPDAEELNDFENPEYMFSTTHTSLLTKIAKGQIDPIRLAKEELANRGLDDNGKWVGFQKAREIHSTLSVVEQIKKLSKGGWTGKEMEALLEQL